MVEEAGEDTDGMAESVSQLQAKLKALTHGKVDIMIDANNFKSTTQILREMASAWKDMTDVERSAALELMGGKRQANILASLISNFDTVEQVIATSQNSAGSALAENEKYLNSIQGKLDQLSNSTQTMWMHFMNSEVVKFLITVATALVKITDQVGLLNVAVAGFMAKTAAKSEKFGIGNLLSNKQSADAIKAAASAGAQVAQTAQNIGGASQTAATGVTILGHTLKAGSLAFKAFNAAATAGLSLLIGFGVNLAVKAIDAWIHRVENLKQEVKELTDEYENANKTFSENIVTLTTSGDTNTYATLLDEFKALAAGVDEYGNNIGLTSSQYERYKAICDQIVGVSPKIAAGYDSNTKAIGNNVNILSQLIELQKIAARQNAEEYLKDENLETIASEKYEDFKEAKSTSDNVDLISEQKNRDTAQFLVDKFANPDGKYREAYGNSAEEVITNMLDMMGYDEDNIKTILEKYADGYGGYNSLDFFTDFMPEISQKEYAFNLDDGTNLIHDFLEEVEYNYQDTSKYAETVQDSKDGLINTLLQVPISSKDYEQLNDGAQKFITEWIKNDEQFKIPDGASEKDVQDLAKSSRDNIKAMISELADSTNQVEINGKQFTAQDLIDQVYNLDPSTVSWEKYKNQIGVLVDGLYELIGGEQNEFGIENKQDLNIAFGVNFEEADGLIDQANEQVDGHLDLTLEQIQSHVDQMNAKQIKAYYSIDWNETDWSKINSWQDILDMVNKQVQSAGNIVTVKTYTDLSDSIDSYNEILSQTKEIATKNTEVTQEYKDSLEALGFTEEEFAECFDANNRLVVTNAKQLKKLVKEKKNEVASDVKLAKAQAQLEYHDLYRQMSDAIDGTSAINGETLDYINSLYDEMSVLQGTIAKLSLLEAKLLGAANAYERLEEAQNIDAANDYASKAEELVNVLGQAFTTSELGTEAAKVAIDGLIPDDIIDKSKTLDEQMEQIYQYFTKGKVSQLFTLEFDDKGAISSAEMTEDNVKKFTESLLSTDYIDPETGNNLGKIFSGTWDEFELNPAITSLEEFAKACGITEEVAFAFLTKLETYDISWLGGDNETLLDQLIGDDIGYKIQKTTQELARLTKEKAELLEGGITPDEQQRLNEINSALERLNGTMDEYRNKAYDTWQSYSDNENILASLDQIEDKTKTLTQDQAKELGLTWDKDKTVQEYYDDLLAKQIALGQPTELIVQLATENVQEEIDDLIEKLGQEKIAEIEAEIQFNPTTGKWEFKDSATNANNQDAQAYLELKTELGNLNTFLNANTVDPTTHLSNIEGILTEINGKIGQDDKNNGGGDDNKKGDEPSKDKDRQKPTQEEAGKGAKAKAAGQKKQDDSSLIDKIGDFVADGAEVIANWFEGTPVNAAELNDSDVAQSEREEAERIAAAQEEQKRLAAEAQARAEAERRAAENARLEAERLSAEKEQTQQNKPDNPAQGAFSKAAGREDLHPVQTYEFEEDTQELKTFRDHIEDLTGAILNNTAAVALAENDQEGALAGESDSTIKTSQEQEKSAAQIEAMLAQYAKNTEAMDILDLFADKTTLLTKKEADAYGVLVDESGFITVEQAYSQLQEMQEKLKQSIEANQIAEQNTDTQDQTDASNLNNDLSNLISSVHDSIVNINNNPNWRSDAKQLDAMIQLGEISRNAIEMQQKLNDGVMTIEDSKSQFSNLQSEFFEAMQIPDDLSMSPENVTLTGQMEVMGESPIITPTETSIPIGETQQPEVEIPTIDDGSVEEIIEQVNELHFTAQEASATIQELWNVYAQSDPALTAINSILSSLGLTESQISTLVGKIQEVNSASSFSTNDPMGLGQMDMIITLLITSLGYLLGSFEEVKRQLGESVAINIGMKKLQDVLSENGWTKENLTTQISALATSLDLSFEGDLKLNTEQAKTDIASLQSNSESGIEVPATVTANDESLEEIELPEDKTLPVTVNLDRKAVDEFNPPNKNGTVEYSAKFSDTEAPPLYGVAYYTAKISGGSGGNGGSGGSGGSGSNGGNGGRGGNGGSKKKSAHVSGTALKTGSWGAPKTETALVGELGPEMLVRNGRWATIGQNGAEFTDIRKGDIIFNHEQTEQLLSKGYVTGRGKAYAEGTAYAKINTFGDKNLSADAGKISSSAKSSTKKSKKSKDAEKDFEEIFDWIVVRLEEITERIDLWSAKLENAIGSAVQNSIIDTLIEGNKQLYENLIAGAKKYDEFANKLLEDVPAGYREAVKNGTIDIQEFKGEGQEEVLEAIEKYREWVQKGAEATQQAEETLTEIADLAKQAIDNIAQEYENKLSLPEGKISQLEAYNELIETTIGAESAKIYKALIKENNNNISVLKEQRDAMQKELNKRVENGEIKKYSDAWYEVINDISEVDTEIIELTADVNDLQDEINELHWDHFENLIDRLEAITNEAKNLIDVLSAKDLVDKDTAEWTDEGITSMALYAQQMENAELQAKKYKEQINYLNKNWRNLGYTEQEYVEKLEELKEGQYDAIKAYNDTKDAIVGLHRERVDAIKDGIEREIEAYEELINKKKEELDAEKDLYDFQKNIADQQKNIADIERKLAALSSDDSASARAKRAQLQAELAEAQQQLQDTYYDRSVTKQQEALDKELENFQDTKNDEMEQWDEYLENTEQVVSDSLAIVQANTETVYQTLQSMGREYSLSIAEALTSPWTDGESAIQSYSEKFGLSMSSTVDELRKVVDEYKEIMNEIEDYGNQVIDKVNENINTYQNVNPQPEKQKTTTPGTPTKTIKVGGQINAGSAKIYDYAGGTSGEKQYYSSDPIYKVLSIQGDWLLVRHHKLSSGTTGWFRKGDVKAYAQGTTGVDKDQLAWIDEMGLEELVMHAGPNGRLQYLTKGTSVIPSDISANLMEWGALDPQNMLDQNRPVISSPHTTNNNIELNMNIDSVVRVDTVTQDTIPDLTKTINKELDKYMKNLNAAIRKYVR